MGRFTSPGSSGEIVSSVAAQLSVREEHCHLPDGSRIVYSSTRRGVPELVMQRLDQLDAMTIPARRWIRSVPFSRRAADWVSTFTELRRVGTAAVKRHDLSDRRVNSRCQLGRQRLCSRAARTDVPGLGLGGTPGGLRLPDASRATRVRGQPVLPGGDSFLYSHAHRRQHENSGRHIRATEAAVLEGGFGPQYTSRRLLFRTNRSLWRRTDPAQFRTIGSPSRSHQASSTNPLTV